MVFSLTCGIQSWAQSSTSNVVFGIVLTLWVPAGCGRMPTKGTLTPKSVHGCLTSSLRDWIFVPGLGSLALYL